MFRSIIVAASVPLLILSLVLGYGLLSSNELRAAGGGHSIGSSTEGALDSPEDWNCERIYPEYKEFLDAGNAPEKWRYVGKRYLNERNGKTYGWRDWIKWANEKGCGGDAELAMPEMAIGELMSTAIPIFGTELIVASQGSGPKSPG